MVHGYTCANTCLLRDVLQKWLPGLIVLAAMRWEMDTDPFARGTTRQAKQEEYDALCKRVADNVPVDLAEYEELVQSYLEMGEEMGGDGMSAYAEIARLKAKIAQLKEKLAQYEQGEDMDEEYDQAEEDEDEDEEEED